MLRPLKCLRYDGAAIVGYGTAEEFVGEWFGGVVASGAAGTRAAVGLADAGEVGGVHGVFLLFCLARREGGDAVNCCV